MKNIILILINILFSVSLIAQPVCPPAAGPGYPVTKGPVFPKDPNVTLPPFDPVSPPLTPPEYDKLVYWVHGLGGEPKGWEKASHYYGNERRMICRRPGYTDVSLDGAAISLFEYMDDIGDAEVIEHGIEDVTLNFVIGHSQGGLVGRSLDWLHAQGNNNVEGQDGYRFGGVVTFGTPNRGAQILNNIDPNGPNMGQEFASAGCEALAEGPIANIEQNANAALDEDISHAVKWVSWLNPAVGLVNTIFGNPLGGIAASQVNVSIPNQAVEFGCNDLISESIIPVVFDPYYAGVTEDYKVGAEYITNLNNFESGLQLVSIYAVEDEDTSEDDPAGSMLWRVMSSFTPEDNPNNAPVFQADDESLPAKAEELEQEYLLKAMDAENEGHDFVKWAYMRGALWLQGANLDWAVIIGAGTVYSSTGCHCESFDDNGNFLFSFPANSVNENPGLPSSPQPPDCSNIQNLPPNTTCYATGTFFYVTVDPSDATVTAASAVDLPGRNQQADVILEGTNHIEMRNNSETKKVFNQLFGSPDINPWFNVDEQ